MHVPRKWYSITLALLLGIFGVGSFAFAEGDPDIFYVPTPQYVVNELLEIAGTNKDDIVYDLGCGDGRFVITAAKKYGARGIGIDIDPERIQESAANARRAGVADRVKFIEADLFKTDVSQATIVALYLLPELNLRLRPKFFKELKPGTRIVSHDFDMNDWEPDVKGKLGNSLYFLWILPADVAGIWNVTLPSPTGQDLNSTVQVRQRFQELDGHAVSEEMAIDISDLKVKGDTVSFFLSRKISQWRVDMHFKGQVKGDSMSGSAQVEGGPFEGLHSWTAVRSK
jgi:SAM-dependent methyltransferase